MEERKAIIVEGKSDKKRLLEVLDEEVDIYCTFGTSKTERLENLVDPGLYHEIFILTDADHAGDQLRARLREYYPEAGHIFTLRMYREVASTPLPELARQLSRAFIRVVTWEDQT
ncbi:MAG: toprim domain-containing protein [Peptococcaceae bacterium]|nr:toprim domain-containing protein [Peptococcaceae bacterium]